MIIATPISVGVITVFFATVEQANRKQYRIFYPWFSIIGWSLLSLLFATETLICVVMLLPIYLPLSSLGGAIGGYVRKNFCNRTNQGVMSCFALLSFLMVPIEMPVPTPTIENSVINTVLINANKHEVWESIPNIENIESEAGSPLPSAHTTVRTGPYTAVQAEQTRCLEYSSRRDTRPAVWK